MNQHLLIVEDDEKIKKLLKQYLVSQDYIVSTVSTIAACEKIIKYFKFDLIVLDIMLPDDSGLNFINRNHLTLVTPIIVLSAMGHVDDRVYALESGARDYITKPFEPRELLARIKNLILQNIDTNTKILNFGDFNFDFSNRTLTKDGNKIHLTQSERDLLNAFCQKPKEVVGRDDLAQTFSDLNARSIDTMIARLRNKIEIDAKSPRFIITERNKGYSFWP